MLTVWQSGESKGTAYVQYKEIRSAQMALDAMNQFELAGRISESGRIAAGCMADPFWQSACRRSKSEPMSQTRSRIQTMELD